MASSYDNFIYRCYRGGNVLSSFSVDAYSCTYSYSKSAAFKKYLVMDVTKNTFEIPCFYKYIICRLLKTNSSIIGDSRNGIFTVPMMVVANNYVTSKSANPILTHFFNNGIPGVPLTKGTAGVTPYIGGAGLIMYADFTPLIMFTLEVENIGTDTIILKPIRQIVRVNPIIYSKEDLLAKHIRNTMLKKIFEMRNATHRMYSNLRNMDGLFTQNVLSYDFKVIIDDFSNFFYTPKVPDIKFTSEEANKMLQEKSEILFSSMGI